MPIRLSSLAICVGQVSIIARCDFVMFISPAAALMVVAWKFYDKDWLGLASAALRVVKNVAPVLVIPAPAPAEQIQTALGLLFRPGVVSIADAPA